MYRHAWCDQMRHSRCYTAYEPMVVPIYDFEPGGGMACPCDRRILTQCGGAPSFPPQLIREQFTCCISIEARDGEVSGLGLQAHTANETPHRAAHGQGWPVHIRGLAVFRLWRIRPLSAPGDHDQMMVSIGIDNHPLHHAQSTRNECHMWWHQWADNILCRRIKCAFRASLIQRWNIAHCAWIFGGMMQSLFGRRDK